MTFRIFPFQKCNKWLALTTIWACANCSTPQAPIGVTLPYAESALISYGQMPVRLCVRTSEGEWAALKNADSRLVIHVQNQRALRGYIAPFTLALLGVDGANGRFAVDSFSMIVDQPPQHGGSPVTQHFSFSLADALETAPFNQRLCMEVGIDSVAPVQTPAAANLVRIGASVERH